MANIRNNTETITSILQAVKDLPEAGGGGVDVSGVTATPSDVLAPKVFVDAGGKEQVGTLATEELTDIEPTSEDQEFAPNSGKLYSKVTIKAIDPSLVNTNISSNAATASDIVSPKQAWVNGKLVTGNITSRSSSNVSVSGATVTVPAGNYPSQVQKSVAIGALSTPSISVSSSGVITATSGVSTAGYLATSASRRETKNLSTASGGTYTLDPGESITRAAGTYLTSALNVTAAASDGSGGNSTYGAISLSENTYELILDFMTKSWDGRNAPPLPKRIIVMKGTYITSGITAAFYQRDSGSADSVGVLSVYGNSSVVNTEPGSNIVWKSIGNDTLVPKICSSDTLGMFTAGYYYVIVQFE